MSTNLQNHSCVYHTFDGPGCSHFTDSTVDVSLHRGITTENLNRNANFLD